MILKDGLIAAIRYKYEFHSERTLRVNNKIKVLQFPIAASKGGITRYVLKNWQYIDKSRFQFDFATMSRTLDFASELEKDGCRIHYISCYAEENAEKFDAEFKEILENGKYDIVHLHTKQWKSFRVEKLAKEAGVPKIIVHSHSTGIDTVDEKKRQAEIELHCKIKDELTEDIATDFWACSRLAASFLFGDKISSDRIKIMNNAIEPERYCYDEDVRQEVRKEFEIEDRFVVGHVGRFAYQKNHMFLIKIFAELCKKKKEAVLLLVGDGELRSAVYQQAADLHIENKVIFAGKRDDVDRLLQAMDIFCFPSWFEGMPITLIEVQAADLACLYSETITDEIELTDRIYRLPLQQEVWVRNILNLSKEYKRRSRMSEMSQKGYSIREQIKNIEKEYRGGALYRLIPNRIGACA